MTEPSTGTVASLYRYPVKGLSPQPEDGFAVSVADGVPSDRQFALALGTTAFDPSHPEPLRKGFFLMLQRNEALARLRTTYDAGSGVLAVAMPDGTAHHFDLRRPEDRDALETLIERYVGTEAAAGRPRLVDAPGHKFTDLSAVSPVMMRAVSVINPASVQDLAARCGRPLDPLRFRGNVHVAGLAPWAEFDWIGREVAIGSARFRCVQRTQRCAAIDVDPVTGARDTALPKALVTAYGHADCGVYLEVLSDGAIAVGDAVRCGPAQEGAGAEMP